MSEWQPIETAPKDGQTIVVGYGRQSGFPVKIVWFNTIHKHWSHYGEADVGLEFNATHWMPLPPPPTETPNYVMPQFQDVLDTVNALSIRSKE